MQIRCVLRHDASVANDMTLSASKLLTTNRLVLLSLDAMSRIFWILDLQRASDSSLESRAIILLGLLHVDVKLT